MRKKLFASILASLILCNTVMLTTVSAQDTQVEQTQEIIQTQKADNVVTTVVSEHLDFEYSTEAGQDPGDVIGGFLKGASTNTAPTPSDDKVHRGNYALKIVGNSDTGRFFAAKGYPSNQKGKVFSLWIYDDKEPNRFITFKLQKGSNTSSEAYVSSFGIQAGNYRSYTSNSSGKTTSNVTVSGSKYKEGWHQFKVDMSVAGQVTVLVDDVVINTIKLEEGTYADFSYLTYENSSTTETRFPTKNPDVYIDDLMITQESPVPTSPIMNDKKDTFDWTYAPTNTNPAEYEYSLDGGENWIDCLKKPIYIGNVNVDKDIVQVRVKAPVGEDYTYPVISNETAFTHTTNIDLSMERPEDFENFNMLVNVPPVGSQDPATVPPSLEVSTKYSRSGIASMLLIPDSINDVPDGSTARQKSGLYRIGNEFEETVTNKVLTMWVYDDLSITSTDHKAIILTKEFEENGDPTVDILSQCMVGFNSGVSKTNYVVRSTPVSSDNWKKWGITTVKRSTGWHQFQFDYTSGDKCEIYIDGTKVRKFETKGMDAYYVQDTWAHSGTAITNYYIDDVTITNSREALPVIPDAPTNPVTDDQADTFAWTYVEGKTDASLYEFSVNGGKSFADCTANPQKVSENYMDIGDVMVRLKATADAQAGVVLRNTVRYTDPDDIVKEKIQEELDFINLANPKDYTDSSWENLQSFIDKCESALETSLDLQACYDDLVNAKDDLVFTDRTNITYTFADKVVPVQPVFGTPDWSDETNVSHLTEKSYKIITETVNGNQIAQFRYTFPKALEEKQIMFYHYADYTGGGWFDITFGNSQDGTGQVLSCRNPNGSLNTYYQLYDLVDGEKINQRSTTIKRRNDMHKFEINMTNGNGTQFYMDTNLISSLVNLDKIDYIDVTVTKAGTTASYISLDDLSINSKNPVQEITMNDSKATLGYRDTYEINHINCDYKTPYDYPTTDKFIYSVSDSNLAKITAGGSIQPKNFGELTATVKTSNGVSKTIDVEIKDFKVEKVDISDVIITQTPNFIDEYVLEPNSIKVFNKIITPEQATNTNVIWTSSNPSVATVKNGEVRTGNIEGSTVITATTVEGNKTDSFTLNVVKNSHEFGVSLFVAKDGNDMTGDGSIENPFASVERARDEARTLSQIIDGGVVVYFREGIYTISEGIKIEMQDSGNADSPVKYKSYNGEDVTFSGGAILKATDFELVSDPDDLNKIQDYAEGKVYVADISEYLGENLLKPLAKGYATNIYPVNQIVKDGINTSKQYYSVTFGQEQMTLSRWPNVDEVYPGYSHVGYAKFDSIPYKGGSIRDWHDDQIGRPNYVPEEERDVYDAFTFSSKRLTERMKSWNGIPKDGSNILDLDIWYEGYTSVSYTTQTSPIRSISSNNVLQSHLACTYWARVDPNTRFYVYNLLQELDIEGEWYIDKNAGKVYIIPPTGADMNDENQTVSIALLGDTMFTFEDTNHVSIEEVTFTNTLDTVVRMYGGSNNKISRSNIISTASSVGGVWDSKNEKAMYSGLEYCNIKDVNGGFTLGGDTYYNEFIPTFNFVNGCVFDNYQCMTLGFNPAVRLQGIGNYVSSNEMKNSPNNAIMWGGNDNVIEFNDIHDVAEETLDTSAIYMGRNVLTRGNVVKNNYFHHLGKTGDFNSNNQAIYLDDLSSGTQVYDNVFEDVYMGVFINGGQDNYVMNNEYIDCRYGVLATDWAYMGMAYWESHGYGTKQNPDDSSSVTVDWSSPESPYYKYHNIPTLMEGCDNQNSIYNKVIDNFVTSDEAGFKWYEYRVRECQPNAKNVIIDWYFDKNNTFQIKN